MTDKKQGKNGDGDRLLYCSFCGKSQHEVRKLIAGPSVLSVMNVSNCVMTSFAKKFRKRQWLVLALHCRPRMR